jgi:hypothetical protein
MFTDIFEHSFVCPYCTSEISMLIDPSIEQQAYIEDCEVCCNPIQIRLKLDKQTQTLQHFEASPMGQ